MVMIREAHEHDLSRWCCFQCYPQVQCDDVSGKLFSQGMTESQILRMFREHLKWRFV